MRMIGSKSRKARAGASGSAPDEEYEVLSDEQLRLHSQIRNLEGFIDVAPQIREERDKETRVTLPPPEDETELPQPVVALDLEGGDVEDEDLQERFGRRHLVAMRRARRTNFFIFLVSAAAVAAFLYWVSLVVQ